MQTDLITIEPEVIQFNRQNTQTIKITNNTATPLTNFFFCLYNVEKFSFKPESFSLAAKEHKLIQITLKIKSTKSIAKQFAYLKSTEVNKRLTLLINNFHSPQSRMKQADEGYSDMNTLSSRDYHELHNRALNKIIDEQQKFMVNDANVRQFNKTQNFSIGSSSKKDFHNIEYVKEVQGRNLFLQRQVEDLNGLVAKTNFQLQKIDHQNKFLSEQGSKLMKKISQKETRIKQLQGLYEKMVVENQNYSSEIKQLKETLFQFERDQQLSRNQQKQKESEISRLFKSYESRIKELENVVESSQRESISKFNQEFKRKVDQKDQELIQIRKSLQHQELLLKQHQITLLKTQSEKKVLEENKKKLEESNKQIQQLNNNLREEIYVYKSRVEQSSNSRVQQYLQIALESYKSENQNLKKSKLELERSLEGIMTTNRETEREKRFVEDKIQNLTKQLGKMQQELARQEKKREQLKEQHHSKLKETTEKNVLLLEKIAEENNTKREQQSTRLQQEIQNKNSQIQKITSDFKQLRAKDLETIKNLKKQNEKINEIQEENTRLEEENSKLEEKMKKYKKQTRKQLKSINDNAFDELKRIHEEKKALQRKVTKLQKSLLKFDSTKPFLLKNQILAGTSDLNSKSYLNSKSQIHEEEEGSDTASYNKQNDSNVRSKSQYEVSGSRKVGIYNQRPQLYDSRSVSTKNALISPDGSNPHAVGNYELYELRQFSAFVHNQQQRFEYMFSLQSELADPLDHNGRPLTNIKPLYKAIKFFKVIEHKLKNLNEKAEQSVILNKENVFIREKLTELQRTNNKEENKRDMSQITVTNPIKFQDEEGPSFLINRTNLTNLNVFEMIEFLKGEMKKQYNKQVQNIKFIEDKYETLKKKIYQEYRTRILELINQNANKKDKVTNSALVSKLQNLIERFVQGLSNLTHKEAVLNKEVKVKNNLKQQNGKLKQKVNQLEHLLSQKHYGYCNRDPVKVFNCSTFINNPNFKEQDWMEGIKLSAQLLTQKAESERLREELDVVREDYNELKQELNELLLKNEEKDSEIIKLKKNQLDLEREYERQLEKQNEIIQETKMKLTSGGSKTKSKGVTKLEEKLKEKQKQVEVLKGEMEKKNIAIRTYKDKERKWEEYINETNRSEEKEKSLVTSYRRIEENNTMIKENNRQLRQENTQLKEIIDKLEKQLEKKKLYIKNLKAEEEDPRATRPLRIQDSILHAKELEEALKNAKEEISKLKKQKDKEIVRLESELTSSKNQALIHIRSLQSVIRATLQTVRKIFASFKILIKKKGLSIGGNRTELIVPQNLLQINAVEIYEQFEEILQAFGK